MNSVQRGANAFRWAARCGYTAAGIVLAYLFTEQGHPENMLKAAAFLAGLATAWVAAGVYFAWQSLKEKRANKTP